MLLKWRIIYKNASKKVLKIQAKVKNASLFRKCGLLQGSCALLTTVFPPASLSVTQNLKCLLIDTTNILLKALHKRQIILHNKYHLIGISGSI